MLEETISTPDSNGSTIFTVFKQHNHDDTNTGELGDAATTPKARVYYSASYFDAANRLTGRVNAGTNGGSTYTRAGSLPTRSDTLLVNSMTYNAAGWTDAVTDPKAIVTATYYDMMGRKIRQIEAYDGVIPPVIGTLPTPTSSTDRATTWAYDGLSHIYQLTAIMPSTQPSQTTQYNYGVTTSGSAINTNDLLASVQYPTKTGMSAGTPGTNASDKQTYAYNAIGQQTSYVDQNGTSHAYTYDLLGRRIADAVTVAGGNPQNVDTSVLRQTIGFDTGGRPYQLTQYDAASSGSVVNQVQDVYNGLGQLTSEYQEHGGSVNTGTSLHVDYAYTEMSGGANYSRKTSITYPNGRVLNYEYSNATVNGVISRVDYLSDNAGTGAGGQQAAYSYLGLGTIVCQTHQATSSSGTMQTTLLQQSLDTHYPGYPGSGDAGDQYTGLDRFGRVSDRFSLAPSSVTLDRFQYGYDRDGNALYKWYYPILTNLSELYHASSTSSGDNATAYDGLGRLLAFQRGTLSGSGNNPGTYDTISSASSLSQHAESWTLDALGNWASQVIDGTSTSRTHDSTNQVTAVGVNNLTFDSNGNTTTDQAGQTYTYDAWNRMIVAKNSGGTTLATYVYDAKGRHIQEIAAATTDIYFTDNWQVIEDRQSTTVVYQYMWGVAYVDELILRDDTTGGGNAWGASGSGLKTRLFALQDANWNVTTLVASNASTVDQRFASDPYGNSQALDGSGASTTDAYAWRYRHQGLKLDTETGQVSNRNRMLGTGLGRFMERDPMGYVDGSDVYVFVGDSPVGRDDPTGLTWPVDMFRDGTVAINPNCHGLGAAVWPGTGVKFVSSSWKAATTGLNSNIDAFAIHFDGKDSYYKVGDLDDAYVTCDCPQDSKTGAYVGGPTQFKVSGNFTDVTAAVTATPWGQFPPAAAIPKL